MGLTGVAPLCSHSSSNELEPQMASLNEQQAGRDAESYDNDRHEGRYAAGGDRASWFPAKSDWGTRPGDAEKQIILDEAMAQIERAFGRKAPAMERAA